jgi:outer membrane protein assembly factor BamD
MPNPLFRRTYLPLWLVAALALVLAPRLSADLAWTPATGWQLQGGTLSGLAGPQGRTALELMNKARIAEEHHWRHSAIRTYEKVAKRYQSSVYASEALYRAGKLLADDRQLYSAFVDFQLMLRRYPNTKRFNDVIGEEYRVAAMLLDGAHNWAWGWLPGFSNRPRGVEYMRVLVVDAPYSDYAPLALMGAARGYQANNDTDEAIDALDRLVNTYPQSVLAPVAYLKLGDMHASLNEGPKYDQASTKEALTYYEDFMILYPADSNIPAAAIGVDKMKTTISQSKIYIGDYYFRKRYNYTAAKVFYNEAITAYPDSPSAAVAKKRLAEMEVLRAKQMVSPSAAPKKRFWLF